MSAGTTTGFQKARGRRSILLVLGTVVGLLAICEATVRGGLGRISQVEGRIESERKAALALRTAPRERVLLVGNSLLIAGIDYPVLQKALAPRFSTARYVVEQTEFLDWYYGLRKLYADGARADAVVLTLGARNMLTSHVRGDYFAYRMMKASDFLDVSGDAGLSPTAAFSLLLGRLSAFYGVRSEIRKVILGRAVPCVKDLIPYLRPAGGPAPLNHEGVLRIAGLRLKQLDELVRAHGGRLIFLAPASRDAHETLYLLEAGVRAGVPVLAPIPSESLSAQDFGDDIHLNARGALRYTVALAPVLKSALAASLNLDGSHIASQF